jgi:ketosteroid isomerase-like protein
MSNAQKITSLVLLTLISCGSKEAREAKETEAIIAGNQYYISLHAGKELDKLMELYEEDGMMLPPGRDPVQGKAAIRAEWQSLFEQFDVIRASSTMDEVLIFGEWAYERGHYTEVMHDRRTGEEVIESGRFAGILRKRDGKWKILRDMWN